METFSGFTAGINLGGWVSQYSHFDHAHFKSFIQEKDIQLIASWGMDHVRLPFDYPILEDDAHPFEYLQSGFDYLDNCIEWCRKAGLNLILDLHRAPGYSFNALDESFLFNNPTAQERLVKLWAAVAQRYAGVEQPRLVFELLNEVVLPDSQPWNDLAGRLVETIRQQDKRHWIMVGGNYYNAISTLKEIRIFDDARIVYTFHFYEPLPFTHQKAYWVPELAEFNHTYDYPSPVTGLAEFLQANPHYRQAHQMESYLNITMDMADLQLRFQDALDFIAQTGKPLYCGEFGVIDRAPLSGKINWNRDFISLLNRHHIGRAYWSYKEMDFGIVDGNGQIVDEQLLQVLCAR